MLSARSLLLALPACLAAEPALAASLSGTAFGGGFAVPLFVLAHLLGLAALGLWAAEQGGGEAGRIALAGLASAILFALLHQMGVRIPYTLMALEGSLLVLGGLVLVGTALPPVVGIVVAVIVGAAQGIHLGAAGGGASALFWLGLLAGAVLAVGGGIGLSTLLRGAGSAMAVRAAGGAVALAGGLMLLNMI